jgi:transcriptional regulator with XRE-family HTH domain
MSMEDRQFRPLADMVRQARISKGMTQRELSRILGMSEGYIGHLESGRFRPNIDTLKSLAAALGMLYGQMAVEAGYITNEEFESPLDDSQLARLNEINDLTNEEWESVQDYARYVRSKRRR